MGWTRAQEVSRQLKSKRLNRLITEDAISWRRERASGACGLADSPGQWFLIWEDLRPRLNEHQLRVDHLLQFLPEDVEPARHGCRQEHREHD